MTHKLWFGQREFPLVPLFDSLPEFNYPFDLLAVVMLSIFLIVFIFKPRPVIGLSIIFIYAYLSILDQNRIQPFFFELIFAVLAMTMFSKNKIRVEQCLLFIFIGTYFWSGIHKANNDFFSKWMMGMDSRIGFVPEHLRMLFTYSIPMLEAMFGILLVFKRTRKYGVLLITLMHFIIVSTLLIEGFGYVVIPLTIFNVSTLFILFYNSNINLKDVFKLNHYKSITVFFVVIIMPLFNFFGWYDHLLSFSYFSGKPKYCRIWIKNKDDVNKLPNSYSKYLLEWNGNYYTDLNYWSQESIGVGVYPEIRVYEQINLKMQNLIGENDSTKIELY